MRAPARRIHPLLASALAPLIAVALANTIASAEEPPARPGYQNLRFEEDWTAFSADDVASKDFFDPIKNIQIGDRTQLSVGGELRTRLEFWENFGFAGGNDDVNLQFRSFVHTDWHFGDHARVFLQGRFSTMTDRDLPGGRRAALDVDEGDLWNAFLELKFKPNDKTYLVRGGRMELQYGSQRLISPLDWSNNRRIFEGALFRVADKDDQWQLDAFWTRPVVIDKYDFNEGADGRDFAGVYFTKKGLGPIGVDAYLLYSEKVAMNDERFTWGSRVFGAFDNGISFDTEAAFQHGDAGSLDVFAWMLAAEGTYTFSENKYTPWLAFGFDYASGDDNPNDGDLGTFDQLYPLGHAYFGYIDAVGRQNIIDLHGTAGMKFPTKRPTSLKLDLHHFWLANEDDALYNAGGGVVRAGGVNERNVGTEIDLTTNVNINAHTKFGAGYGVFIPDDFIDTTGPSRTTHFLYSQLQFTF